MEKDLYNLSTEEFVRLLCGEHPYGLTIDDVGVYDYLDKRTRGFKKEICDILLKEMYREKRYIDGERYEMLHMRLVHWPMYEDAVKLLEGKIEQMDCGCIIDECSMKKVANEPEIHAVNQKKKRGRPSKPFSDILAEGKEDALQRLHELIDGKTDSKTVLYIKAAMQLGMILKPTHTQFINEFGNIVSKQIFNKYLNANLYSDDELAGAKRALTNK